MEMLHERFEASLERMGLRSLDGPVFSGAAAGLRFAVGGSEEIYLGDHRKPNGAYIENAVDRALTLFEHLPGRPDLLRIDGCPGLGFLPPPTESAGNSDYWALTGTVPFLRKLFREIVRSELDPAGIEGLVSSVFFLDSRRDILFQLYDDRGCDVAAPDKALLEPLFRDFRAWIPEDVLPQIHRLFGE